MRFDTREAPFTEADAVRYLLHEDGYLRVPVLVLDDLLVRGLHRGAVSRGALSVKGRPPLSGYRMVAVSAIVVSVALSLARWPRIRRVSS